MYRTTLIISVLLICSNVFAAGYLQQRMHLVGITPRRTPTAETTVCTQDGALRCPHLIWMSMVLQCIILTRSQRASLFFV